MARLPSPTFFLVCVVTMVLCSPSFGIFAYPPAYITNSSSATIFSGDCSTASCTRESPCKLPSSSYFLTVSFHLIFLGGTYSGSTYPQNYNDLSDFRMHITAEAPVVVKGGPWRYQGIPIVTFDNISYTTDGNLIFDFATAIEITNSDFTVSYLETGQMPRNLSISN
jgi:hypothetical protein